MELARRPSSLNDEVAGSSQPSYTNEYGQHQAEAIPRQSSSYDSGAVLEALRTPRLIVTASCGQRLAEAKHHHTSKKGVDSTKRPLP